MLANDSSNIGLRTLRCVPNEYRNRLDQGSRYRYCNVNVTVNPDREAM